MKKILLSISLLFTLAYTDSLTPTISSDSEVGKWRSFFGVDGGVGLMDIQPSFMIRYNHGLFENKYILRGISYGAGILGGWQKYTSEKIGMRNTLGLKIFGTKKTKEGDMEAIIDSVKPNALIIDSEFYYALDGLFDFVKNGDNHIGMSLGFSANILHLTFEGACRKGGGLLRITPRLGFYSQFNNHIIDFLVSIPLIGTDFGNTAFNSTITLGYKHLF